MTQYIYNIYIFVCVCVYVMESRLLLSSFSNQLSRAFSPFCRSKQAGKAGMGLRPPAGRPASLPACLPAGFFIYVLSLSVSLQKRAHCRNALRISLSLSVSAQKTWVCVHFSGAAVTPRKYVRILHTSNTLYMY
jgi:hypothetical protein